MQALRWAVDEAREWRASVAAVIAWVPPSALMDEMRHGLLPWSLRGRQVLVPDLDNPDEGPLSSA